MFDVFEPWNAIEGIADVELLGLPSPPTAFRRCTANWCSGPETDTHFASAQQDLSSRSMRGRVRFWSRIGM